MTRDHPGPDRDRLTMARLTSTAYRHARWGAITAEEMGAGAAELREAAGGRPDLLAELAGLALGTAEGNGDEYRARAQVIAELCRLAGADETLIPQWTQEGRRRAEAPRLPPFSRPSRASSRRGDRTGNQSVS